MKKTTRNALRWWHLAFGIVAVFFAFQYLHDGLAEGGAASDRAKGFAWIAIALLMIVPELIRRRRNGPDDGSAS